jgi:DNA ligase-1
MKFEIIAKYFNQLEQTNSRLEMATILKNMFEEASSDEIQKLVYFCQGNVGPVYQGQEINIGTSTLLSLIARYLGQNLSVVKQKYNQLGDLGLVIENTQINLKQSTLFSKSLSFLEVYSIFYKISKIKGKGAIEKKIKLLESILFNSDKISVKYIVKFSISFRLGFSDSTIIDALSFLDKNYDQKEARKIIAEKNDIISDLGLIAKKIKTNGINEIKHLEIQPFIPIKPALCERSKDFNEITDRLSGKEEKEFIVDSKIDGFRMQIHKFDEKIKIFSRNEEEITFMFPDIVENIKKINYNFIIDCEAIAYDPENKKYHLFQITMQRKRKYDINEKSKKLPLHLKVFDVLYFKNKQLINTSNIERRKIVEKYFNIPPIIKPTEIIITKNINDLKSFFNSRINLSLEGIIAKDLQATYKAGTRGFNWIKYKKSYNNITDTIDAVVIGGFYGQGKRSNKGIGALLMGIYDTYDNKYYTIAKLGSGLTDDILYTLKKKIKPLRLNKKQNNFVTNIDADFYISPKIVIEINYDDITSSSVHTVCYNKNKKQGLALRFPRFVRFREDKSETQTTSKEEIKRLFEIQKK